MLNQIDAEEILNLLRSLPEEKLAEAKDYLLFLKTRYGVDESNEWSEEDIKDLTAATLKYSDETL